MANEPSSARIAAALRAFTSSGPASWTTGDVARMESAIAAADAVERGLAANLAQALRMAEVEIERAVAASPDAWTEGVLRRVRSALGEFDRLSEPKGDA
jgi:hypothetical protein